MIKIVIPGRPVPKARPRLSKAGRKTLVYTPRETSAYEKTVGYMALNATKGKSFTKDIVVYIRLYFKNRKIGDVDNYAKSILDGLQGIVFENDKQVAKLSIERCFDSNERAEVEIREVS